jgi:hypothetical protein
MAAPIEDSALLSDLQTGPLVSPNGSVEWLFPRFDSPSLFSARVGTDEQGHINQMLELTPKLARYFLFRPWVLYRFSARSLLTCDTPVSLVPHLNGPMADAVAPEEGVGLMTAWGITFPLTRKIGLLRQP